MNELGQIMAIPAKKKRSRSEDAHSGDGPPAGEEDVPFPRGGASLLTPLEERQLKVRAKADFERETAAGGPKKKKKRQNTSNVEHTEVRGAGSLQFCHS